jgi:peptidylprolyl isomerase
MDTQRLNHHDFPSFKYPAGTHRAALVGLGVILFAQFAASVALAEDPQFSAIPQQFTAPPPDATVAESGLAWKVLKVGDGERHPDDNDLVLANYTGWNAEGEIFQSNVGSTELRLFDLESVFPGWREGIKLMVSGETRRLWIPAALAPQKPDKGLAGPVVFDVELVGFRLVPNPPESGVTPSEGAVRMPSGGHSKVFEEGQGSETPGPTSRVLVNYIGWNRKGRIFDSTLHRGRPTAFLLDNVIPQFSEAVQEMVVGEKRHLWIPAVVAAGQWPKAPKKGMLMFEVELLRILPEGTLELKDQGEATKTDQDQDGQEG